MNSLNQGKQFIKNWFQKTGPFKSILDVGAGCGTYYDLLHELGGQFKAIEIWKPYIDEFELRKKYYEVFDTDIRAYSWSQEQDVIIFGDILEHLHLADSTMVVKKAKEICKYIIISIPISFCPQDKEHGNPYQKHIVQDFNLKQVRECFGPFEVEYTEECKIGRHGKPLNNPITIGVFIWKNQSFGMHQESIPPAT